MSALAMADNPALLDPMHALTGPERTLLRKLDSKGPAQSLGFRRGWMLDGVKLSDAKLQRMIELGLARFWRDDRGVWLMTNQAGALAAYRITPSRPAAVTPDAD